MTDPGNTQIVPIGQSALNPAARVMSPRMHPNEGILTGLQATCQICNQMTFEPAVCARCGTYGHPVCLGLERFCDFPFCSRCIPEVTAEYASFQDSQRRESWRRSITDQISTWKSRAVEAVGMSSTFGVVVGGAVATAAGAAAGLAQGAVRGAVEVVSTPRAALPPPTPTMSPSSLR